MRSRRKTICKQGSRDGKNMANNKAVLGKKDKEKYDKKQE